MAGMYAVWHGPEGLRRIAGRVALQARLLADAARRGGFALRHDGFFDTIALEAGDRAEALVAGALARGFNLRREGDARLHRARRDGDARPTSPSLAELLGGGDLAGLAPLGGMPAALARRSGFCTAEVFNSHHSEHAMLRYLKRLEDKDVALNRSMIPLGSCTMKLNATAEMIPITFPGFAEIHPFAPPEQAEGYFEMIKRLEGWLCAVTGFAAASLQPNAGSQGEYAGLLAIRAYHHSRGDTQRDVCLIPSSAHGTNPASAVMAGMKVVVVGCDRDGNVDLADLKAKAGQFADRLAALMVTYPSTHGVFEEEIRAICDLVHAHGGQVYMDGANMNAQVGLTSPGRHRRRCLPPEPAQDLLHPAWRRRARRRADRRRGASRAAPAEPPAASRRRAGDGLRAGERGALRQRRDPADLLRLYPHDGRRGADAGDAGRDPQRQLHGEAAGGALPRAVPRPRAAWWRMNASSTAAASSRAAACWSRTSPSGCRITATTRRPCPGR